MSVRKLIYKFFSISKRISISILTTIFHYKTILCQVCLRIILPQLYSYHHPPTSSSSTSQSSSWVPRTLFCFTCCVRGTEDFLIQVRKWSHDLMRYMILLQCSGSQIHIETILQFHNSIAMSDYHCISLGLSNKILNFSTPVVNSGKT